MLGCSAEEKSGMNAAISHSKLARMRFRITFLFQRQFEFNSQYRPDRSVWKDHRASFATLVHARPTAELRLRGIKLRSASHPR